MTSRQWWIHMWLLIWFHSWAARVHKFGILCVWALVCRLVFIRFTIMAYKAPFSDVALTSSVSSLITTSSLSLSLLPAVNHCFSFNRIQQNSKSQFNYYNIWEVFPNLSRQHLFGHVTLYHHLFHQSGIIIYLSCLFRLWAPREYMLLCSVGPSESPK